MVRYPVISFTVDNFHNCVGSSAVKFLYGSLSKVVFKIRRLPSMIVQSVKLCMFCSSKYSDCIPGHFFGHGPSHGTHFKSLVASLSVGHCLTHELRSVNMLSGHFLTQMEP
jgi:hypothetical protein